jgi:hypothetical protein
MKKGIVPKKVISLRKPVSVKKSRSNKNMERLAPFSRKANRYFELFFFLFALVLYGNTILNKFAFDDTSVTSHPGNFSDNGFFSYGNSGLNFCAWQSHR